MSKRASSSAAPADSLPCLAVRACCCCRTCLLLQQLACTNSPAPPGASPPGHWPDSSSRGSHLRAPLTAHSSRSSGGGHPGSNRSSSSSMMNLRNRGRRTVAARVIWVRAVAVAAARLTAASGSEAAYQVGMLQACGIKAAAGALRLLAWACSHAGGSHAAAGCKQQQSRRLVL